MDKKTTRLLREYGVTEEMLDNAELSIKVDVTGCEDFFEEKVEELNLIMEPSEERGFNAKRVNRIAGNAKDILGLIGLCSSAFGPECMIAVFVASAGCFVMMKISEAKIKAIQEIKEAQVKENDSESK